MSILPPATKLTLVERKNIRDNWDADKAKFEQELNDLVGPGWSFEIDPLVVAPYVAANESYAGRPGDVIRGYAEDAVFALKSFTEYNPTAKDELNKAITQKAITLEADADGKVSYSGAAVRDGKLVVLFHPDNLWVNTSSCFDNLLEVLSEAEAAGGSGGGLSPVTRAAIATNWEPEASKLQEEFAKVLNNSDIRLEPNWDATYAALKDAQATGASVRDDWESALPAATVSYFEGALFGLKGAKFDEDDLLQEAFAEVVKSNTIAFRVVPSLTQGTYAEAEVESGTLYIQTVPNRWYSNVDSAFEKIVDVISEAEANL